MYEKIKEVAANVCYLHGGGEMIPPPVNADTASMVFVEAGGYVVGFTSLTDEEREAVLLLLGTPTAEERLAAMEEALLSLILGGM